MKLLYCHYYDISFVKIPANFQEMSYILNVNIKSIAF